MIELDWHGGKSSFRLRLGELRALQEKCDAGPMLILDRLRTRVWRVDDVRETIRLGLIGAGMPAPEANKLVELHVDNVPLAESVMLAHAVLASALVAPESVPQGKPQAGETATEEIRSSSSSSPPSTD